jgi:hypothetical protein
MLATTTNMIPVVFGGVNYADFVPSEVGYLDALNHSPQVLGYTLNYLVANETAFNKYKEWRTLYDLELVEWPCALCQNLRLQGRNSLSSGQTLTTTTTPINAQAQASDGLCTSWPNLDFAQQQPLRGL